MKTKLVLWGSNDQDERLLIALELRADDNMVNVYSFPETEATEAFSQRMLNEWRDGKAVEFPENHGKAERSLSISESMLPPGLKVERDDILQRAQTEWHFIVLSSKLNETYQNELHELANRIEGKGRFEESLWDELKTFWDKVQAQVRDRNLFRDHANELRDRTNALFTRMKEMRTHLDAEFERLSQENYDRLLASLQDLEARVAKGLRLQPIFEELKNMQREFREVKFTREHRTKAWDQLDAAFKRVKEKRFGSAAADDRSPLERLKRRYDGLMSAIDKMDRSIKRDRSDLDFQNRKVARTDGQLEAQLRMAKIKMIEERIHSKEEKLGEMMQTKGELDRRMETLREKEALRAEQERVEQARRKAQEKIAEEIKQAAAARVEESPKLEKAAESIRESHHEEKESAPAAEEPAQAPAAPAVPHLDEVVDNLDAIAAAVESEVEAALDDLDIDEVTDELAAEAPQSHEVEAEGWSGPEEIKE